MPSQLPFIAPSRPPASKPAPCGLMALAGLLAMATAGALLAATGAQAQQQSASPKAAANVAAKPTTIAKPAWRDLGAPQQKALEPLASTWDDLTEPHKRKWLVIVRDYDGMSTSDQEVLHSRMKAWARLSNRERDQARLNFGAAKQLPADERKAKWEAYQALSDEEKGKLAARAGPVAAPGAAATIRPVPAQKLAPVPTAGPDAQHTPRILLAPPVVAARPQAPAASAPVSAEAQVPPPAPSTPAGEAPTASSTLRHNDAAAPVPASAP
ncbi:DUF3106 domain-containing protein [Variovorax sp. J22P168]|uniref:DUF3106 domain-containing protein n=1 Tax=Variovorax jilinensis TaxID=3053513 RepID=UPI002576884B|nr:DUF3106 domain-containing protein [Variovorax sp. J22P168]MDM0013496.1 DUF3106 domain-containing protein [Variovorax sp. J22P168]